MTGIPLNWILLCNIHVCTTTDDDDRRHLISRLVRFLFTFSRSLSLKYFIKKTFAIVLQKLVSHKRAPHKKERRQRIVFSLFLLHIYKANERISFNMRTLIPINNSLKTVGNINTDAEYIKK